MTQFLRSRTAGAMLTAAIVGLTAATLFVLALAFAWYISRRYIAHPIGALVSGTRAVAAGDLSVVIPVRREDEIGDLATSFNEMTTTLAALVPLVPLLITFAPGLLTLS